MILEIARPFGEGKNWKVAGNPIKFHGFESLNLRPPLLGEHKEFYFNNFGSIISNEPKFFFQPQKRDYSCKITLRANDNKVSEFYACSYTWLKSKEIYLICSLEKIKFIPLENSVSTISFNLFKSYQRKRHSQKSNR